MTITVDMRPEVQVELARLAAAYGTAIESYAASLLEEAVHLPAGTNRCLSIRNGRKPQARAFVSCARGSRLRA